MVRRTAQGRGYPLTDGADPRHRSLHLYLRTLALPTFPHATLEGTMAAMISRAQPLGAQRSLFSVNCRLLRHSSTQTSHNWGPRQATQDAARDEVATLATSPRRPLTLADLLK